MCKNKRVCFNRIICLIMIKMRLKTKLKWKIDSRDMTWIDLGLHVGTNILNKNSVSEYDDGCNVSSNT